MFSLISQDNKFQGRVDRIYKSDNEIYSYDEIGNKILLGEYKSKIYAAKVFKEITRLAEDGFTYDTLDGAVRTTKSKFYRLPKDNK